VTIQVNSLAPPPSSFRPLPAQLDTFEIERAFASGQGAVVGITDFVLQRLRSFQADTNTECTVLEVQRSALEVMVSEVPAVATALQVRDCVGLYSGQPVEALSTSVVEAAACFRSVSAGLL
jgi:hypothetical protein